MISTNPLVSIVIVNWKTPRLLAACLDSILKDEKHGQFEVWVADNNSQDESVEMLKRDYPGVNLIANAENLGFGKACNQVIPQAQGKYVLLLNPDTIITDSAISKMASYMDEHPECGAAGPQVLNPDGTLQLACRRSFPDPWAAFFRLTYLSMLFPNNKTFAKYNMTFADPKQVLEVDALSGSCMMVRNSLIDAVGLMDEDIFMYGEDIDWCWRIKEHGFKVIYIPDAVVYHYHGASSRLRPIGATINLHRGMHVFYEKHLAKKYWAPFNWLVYAGIYLRCFVFIVLGSLKQLLPSESQVPESVMETQKAETK